MNSPDLDQTLFGDFLSAAGALVTRQLNLLPETARLAVADAVNGGASRIELRMRLEDGETEIVLVPIKGGAVQWLARTSPLTH